MFKSNRESTQGERVEASLQDVQNYLQSPGAFSEPNAAQLNELQDRLARVRRLGGAFESIGFSPDMQRLLSGSKASSKSKMATV